MRSFFAISNPQGGTYYGAGTMLQAQAWRHVLTYRQQVMFRVVEIKDLTQLEVLHHLDKPVLDLEAVTKVIDFALMEITRNAQNHTFYWGTPEHGLKYFNYIVERVPQFKYRIRNFTDEAKIRSVLEHYTPALMSNIFDVLYDFENKFY
jgi:hypothetical protein